MAQVLLTHIQELVTMQGALARQGRGPLHESDLSVFKKQAMVLDGEKILWIGSQNKIPREYKKIKNQREIQANIYPGFIDCHTHSLFAGDRAHEFELRNQGQTYQQIAEKGGGILFTVRETRKAKVSQLTNLLQKRMLNFLAQGVTTVEVKSGYGLTVEEEIRLLKVIRETTTPVQMVPTFLGAHARSPESKTTKDYLDLLQKALPQIAKQKLSRRVDIFIEKNYFSIEESKPFLQKALEHGFDVTIHADQMNRTGATWLAVDLKAKSADHVICIDEQDIAKVAKSSLTCVLLPTADFYLRCPYPPARALIDGGARVALATDFNPGTSPTQNIQWVGLLARQEMKMTLPEVFSAFTVGGAYALGLEKERGVLAESFSADFFVSEKNWDQFFYDLSPIPMASVWVKGKPHKV